MSWGVATQNGVSVSLASIVSLSCGATEAFSPASLFTSGVAGAWYDPSDVLLNWRTNLLTYTQEFDNAAWTKSNATITADATTAPDGTATADNLSDDNAGGTGVVGVTRNFTIENTTNTFSFYAKANGLSWVSLQITGFTSAPVAGACYYDLANGVVGGVNQISGTITNVGGGWFRCTGIVTPAAGDLAGNFAIYVADANNDIIVDRDGTSSIYIWGAQLELGSTATAYQAITTPEQTYLTYDPQPVLYQDSAGTTPVTAVEQPVGLMLDKSQGLVLGSEATSGAWLNGYTTTFDTFASTGPSSFTATTTGAKSPRVAVLASLPAAGWYWIEFTATFTGGSFTTSGFSNTGSPYSAAVATTVLPTSGVTFRTLIYTSAAREYLTLTFIASGASTLSVSGVSVKSYAGNHASQATAASRPVLRARYNLLTYSEQFDNAVWVRTGFDAFGSGSVANATTAPDGTTTADFVRPGTVSSSQRFTQNPTPTQTAQTLSIYVKASGYSKVALKESATTGNYASFDLSTGTVLANTAGVGTSITALANSWYRISMTLASAGSSGLQVSVLAPAYTTGDPNGSTFSGDGTSGIYVWGADLRTGSSAGTYQRIAAATDYATAGFLPYLAGDGVDDQMVIPTAAISGATAITELHGAWRPTGFASSNGTIFGGIGTGTTNDHEPFSDNALYYGFASTSRQDFGSLGTVTTPYILDATQTGTTLAAFKNNVQLSTTKTVALGIGTTPRLFLSNNATNYFYAGNLFGGVLIQKVLSASEMASLRSWMAAKSGVTL